MLEFRPPKGWRNAGQPASQQQHLTPPDTDTDTDTDTDDDTILPTVQTALTPYVRDGYNVMADG